LTRWIAVSTDYLNANHRMHPHSTAEPACKAFAWIDLIGLAAWRDHGGLKRGQARASQRFLAARWNWHRSKVQRFLDELESSGSIDRGRGASREPDRITICNYDAYQETRSTNRSTDRSTNRSKEVPVPVPTSKRARARRNGRKPPRPSDPIDMRDASARPEAIRDILDGLKRQVNGGDP